MLVRDAGQRPIYLSSIGYVHGRRRSVADLGNLPACASLLADGLATYRAADGEVWELATVAAESTLGMAAGRPDAVLYVSQNEPDSAESLPRIADRLDLTDVDYLSLSGHDCGNFGPSLRAARDMIHSGGCDRVLLLLADRARSGRRVMANGLSVFSDGAAACFVTRDPRNASGPQFGVDAVVGRTRVRVDDGTSPGEGILPTVVLARATVDAVLRGTGREREDFQHVLFPNYRTTAQLFLAAAMGFPAERLLPGSVADLAHCFSADILVTLDEQHAAGRLQPGSRLLASTTGPHSWSSIALECL
jgi:3-oxoacyl-[acyl-carrier-protein] synthase-3